MRVSSCTCLARRSGNLTCQDKLQRHRSLPSHALVKRGPIPHRIRKVAPEAAAAAAPTGPLFSWEATGVPLVEELMELTLPAAAAKSAVILGATVLAVWLGHKVQLWAEERLAAWVERAQRADGWELLMKTALVAVQRPAGLILPLLGTNYALLVLSAFAEVAVIKLDSFLHKTFKWCGHWALQLLKNFTQFLQDSSEVLTIILVAWFLIAWKNHFIEALSGRMGGSIDSSSDVEGEEDRWSRVLVPLSAVMTYAISGTAFTLCLSAVGIDIRPLLAFGSISSLLVGFAAQQSIGNFVSAMSLYAARPFIKGDRIQLKSLSGSTIVAGVVEQIRPMRTMIRTDARFPVYINNKDVAGLLIVNESQQRFRGSVRPPIPLLDAELVVRCQDVDRLEDIEREIAAFINSCHEVEPGSGKCHLAGFNERGAVLSLKGVIKLALASTASAVRAKVLRGAEKIVRQQGAMLFMLPLNSEEWVAAIAQGST